MTEAKWLASTDPAEMLAYLDGRTTIRGFMGVNVSRPQPSERKLRLFACAVLLNGRCVAEHPKLQAIEEFSEGHITAVELRQHLTGFLLSDLTALPERAAAWAVSLVSMNTGATPSYQAALLRDIIGNPWRPVQLQSAWLSPTVQALARTAYEERRPDGTLDPQRLLVLSDALEEAGCTDEAILRHLRGTVLEYNNGGISYWHTDISGPQLTPDRARSAHVHVRGCWALDLLLGKE